jgi:hypothetical protein
MLTLVAYLIAYYIYSFYHNSLSKITPSSFAEVLSLMAFPFMMIYPVACSFLDLVRWINLVFSAVKEEPVHWAHTLIQGMSSS